MCDLYDICNQIISLFLITSYSHVIWKTRNLISALSFVSEPYEKAAAVLNAAWICAEPYYSYWPGCLQWKSVIQYGDICIYSKSKELCCALLGLVLVGFFLFFNKGFKKLK